jgi:hypothetical protein
MAGSNGRRKTPFAITPSTCQPLENRLKFFPK